MILWCKQGRLEPIQTYVKNNKRGLGAEKVKKKTPKPVETPDAQCKNDNVSFLDYVSHILKFCFLHFSVECLGEKKIFRRDKKMIAVKSFLSYCILVE